MKTCEEMIDGSGLKEILCFVWLVRKCEKRVKFNGGIFCLGLNSMKITSGKEAFILFFLMI